MKNRSQAPARKNSRQMAGYITIIACGLLAVALCAAIILSAVAKPREEPGLYADIVIKGYGTVTVKLEPDAAPITVNNFVELAKEGFYDGLTFHRIKDSFMMQGGDPKGNGTGSSAVKIKGEFTANGVNNPLKHTAGAISMARGNDYDSASCQFFIVHKSNANASSLDGLYAVFGYVTSGMDIVDEICSTVKGDAISYLVDKEEQPIIQRVTIREVK